MDPDFAKMMKQLCESNNSLLLDHFNEQVKSNYVSRKENMEDKLKIKQLEMQLQSANSKLKKVESHKENKVQSEDVIIEIADNENPTPSLSGIKREVQVTMPNTPTSNPVTVRVSN